MQKEKDLIVEKERDFNFEKEKAHEGDRTLDLLFTKQTLYH